MSTKSDSEEAEFEDAVDTLADLNQNHNYHQQSSASAAFQTATTDEAQNGATPTPTIIQQPQPQQHLQHSIPPPMGPPPPLPEYLTSPESELPPSLPLSPTSPIPPPLPPRRPMAAAKNQQQPLNNINNVMASSTPTTGVETTPAKSPDQQSFGRQRGHAKTNSLELDRGLSLAKCLKTGPFPPPTASKSNSTTRGASPSDVMPVLDEQDTQAQGVIQGVIQQVLATDNTSMVDEAEKSNVNGIKDSDNQTPSTSLAHTATETLQKAGISHPHYENLSNPPYQQQQTSSSGKTSQLHLRLTIKKSATADGKQHRRSASDKSPSKIVTKSSSSSIQHQHHKSSTWEPQQKAMIKTPTTADSLDPITRDVERRMSLKERAAFAAANKQQAQDSTETNNDAASSTDEVFGQKHTSVEHIRRFAHTYGMAASDFLRGTVLKFRQQAAHLATNRPGGKKTAEIFGSEIDRDGASSLASDELSVANCVSESLPVPGATPLGRKMRATNSAEPPASANAKATAAAATTTAGICRPKNAKKGPFDFEQLRLVQEMNNEHTGAVWCLRFSNCGRLLATAGQDRNVRVWVLRSQLNQFTALRERYGKEVAGNLDYSAMQNIGNMRPELYDCDEEDEGAGSATSASAGKCQPPAAAEELPTPGSAGSKAKGSSLGSSSSSFASSRPQSGTPNGGTGTAATTNASSASTSNSAVFSSKPFCIFRGHTADVLDLSWSPRNYFLLSGGMDRTVKLWHLTRNECLCSFQHIDFVTCIAFMPKDDRYFISGSLDGKLRLWHVPEKRVAIWNEVEEVVKFITAITFVKNGKFVVVGTYSGRCFFYSTDQLKYHTVIDVMGQKSSKGKHSRGHCKVTSLAVHGDKLLVTSNDSRIRIYDLRDMDLCCKFKGAQIEQSQIRAAFSPDGKYIVSGSEDNFVYLWRTSGLPSSLTVRKDRNHAWERIRAHQNVVTTAAFAPKPQLILSWLMEMQKKAAAAAAAVPSPAPLTMSTPEPSATAAANLPPSAGRSNASSSAAAVPIPKRSRDEGRHSQLSKSMERPFLALASRLALPTANLTDIQLRRAKPSTASLGYSSSMLSIPGSASALSLGDSLASARDRRAMGDVIVSADLSGSLKVFVNATRLQTGASNFFPFC